MSAVVVAGLGCVGLPLAMRAVAAGHEVTGYDTDAARVERLEARPGVGGHCLPIDPSYLSWRVERTLGQRFRFVELAIIIRPGTLAGR